MKLIMEILVGSVSTSVTSNKVGPTREVCHCRHQFLEMGDQSFGETYHFSTL